MAGDSSGSPVFQPVADAVGVADTRHLAPRIEQHDDHLAFRDPGLHDQTVAGLVQTVLTASKGSFVRTIRVGTRRSRGRSDSTWAYISIAAPSADHEALAMWQADVVAGVLADGGQSPNQSDNLAGYNIIETRPNRTSSGEQRGVGAQLCFGGHRNLVAEQFALGI